MLKSFSFRAKLISIISLVYFISFFALYNLDNLWENGDSSGYYMHLVSFLVHNDVGSYHNSTKAMIESHPSTEYLLNDPFWMRETGVGKKYIKYTIGVAIMEIPGFVLGHLYANLDQDYKSDGWSKPYIVAINISKILYIIIGFYFLIEVLLKYYKPTIVALTVLGIAFGTNLFFHVPNLTLAHPFLFFDFCMLLYFTDRFYSKPNLFSASTIGVLLGLITVTRVPEVVALVIPVFWGVFNKETLLERATFFKKNISYVVISILIFITILIPQIAYWHFVSGQLFFNPYDGEGFNFLKPKFIEALFSMNNGWLIYTPLMFFPLFVVL